MEFLNPFKDLMKFVSLYYYKGLNYTGTSSLTRKVMYKVNILYKTRGSKAAATYIKLCRLAITKHLAGQKVSRPFGISLTADGLPSLLPPRFREGIRSGDRLLISWLLTLFQVGRPILGDKSKFSTKTITDPWTGYNPISEVSMFSTLNQMDLHRGLLKETVFKSFPWISTSGPNGLSIGRALEDIKNLPKPLLDSMITLNGGPEGHFAKCIMSLTAFVEVCWPLYSSLFKIKEATTKKLRKISIKQDKEGKTRPFAIFDYISQSALTELHDEIYRILKRIPQDATFDQNAGFREILYGQYKFYASYDLTAATDRFPMELQTKVLEFLYDSKEMADAWAYIMTSEPFMLPNRKYVRFEVGQPLGAKSSWAVFSLTHHFVVHYSAQRINMSVKDLPYRLLGDDIVIMDPDLAQSYLEVMTQLGVELSPTKSHVSNDIFEFAKRWSYKGVEVTPFPITGLLDNMKIYSLFSQVLSVTAPERGFLPLFVQGNSPTFWEDIAKLVVPQPYTRLRVYIANKYKQFSLLPYSTKPLAVSIQDLLTLCGAVSMDEWPLIDKALKLAIVEIREREIDKLTNLVFKYSMSIQGLLSQLLMSPLWGRIFVSHREYLPVISAVDTSTRLKTEKMVDVREIQSGMELSKALEADPIRPVPSLKGLQPVRPNEVIARSRAALLKPLLNQVRILRKERDESSSLK